MISVFSQQGVKKEVAESVLAASLAFEESLGKDGGKDFDEVVRPLYQAMTDDIRKQKKRLGGDFAIAHAVASRVSRDFIREELGNDVVFVVLNLTNECQVNRIKGRHGEEMEGAAEMMGDMYKLYEEAGTDEPNAVNVVIEEGETPAMVLEKVLNAIKE